MCLFLWTLEQVHGKQDLLRGGPCPLSLCGFSQGGKQESAVSPHFMVAESLRMWYTELKDKLPKLCKGKTIDHRRSVVCYFLNHRCCVVLLSEFGALLQIP